MYVRTIWMAPQRLSFKIHHLFVLFIYRHPSSCARWNVFCISSQILYIHVSPSFFSLHFISLASQCTWCLSVPSILNFLIWWLNILTPWLTHSFWGPLLPLPMTCMVVSLIASFIPCTVLLQRNFVLWYLFLILVYILSFSLHRLFLLHQRLPYHLFSILFLVSF